MRRVWSEYLRGGLVAAHGKPKGGRRHAHLSVAQERAVLRPLEQQAHTGRVVTARRIKTRYEDRVGHGMPDATIYRLLAPPPGAAGAAPAQASARESGRAGRFKKNSRPQSPPWRLGTHSRQCGRCLKTKPGSGA